MQDFKWNKEKKVEEIVDELDQRETLRLDKWGKSIEDASITRVSSGLPGFDVFMENGFPKGSNIIVSGSKGTGKSTFAMQFIAQGCNNGERCLYITVEQPPTAIIKQAMQYHWPFAEWENQGTLQFAYLNFKKPMSSKTFEYIIRTVEQNKWDRVVLDSISAFMNAHLPISYSNVLELFEKTAQYGVTTLCVAQKDNTNRSNDFIEYVGDGVVSFERKILGQTSNRTIAIEKLRWTKIDDVPHNVEFTENGLSVID